MLALSYSLRGIYNQWIVPSEFIVVSLENTNSQKQWVLNLQPWPLTFHVRPKPPDSGVSLGTDLAEVASQPAHWATLNQLYWPLCWVSHPRPQVLHNVVFMGHCLLAPWDLPPVNVIHCSGMLEWGMVNKISLAKHCITLYQLHLNICSATNSVPVRQSNISEYSQGSYVGDINTTLMPSMSSSTTQPNGVDQNKSLPREWPES